MRAEWNARAREDAHYFVAFGRRDQDDEEFFATGADLVRELEGELKRLPAGVPAAERRALEIGCGPGRLMRPMSRHFGEIHGIDVSDEMIARAREKLRGVPHAHVHHAGGSDLSMFLAEYFDFVYSYAVFQHIPSAEVVFSYLRETVRVLKPGGVAHLQINGLPKSSRAYTTWEGVRIGGDEIHGFTQEQGVRLLALTGIDTQYMWTTWQKPPAPPSRDPDIPFRGAGREGADCCIRAISNALSSEQAVPSGGRLACAALSIENLPDTCDLNSLEAFVDGIPGTVCYIGPAVNNGLSQVNVFLPKGVRTGLLPVRVEWQGQRLCPDRYVRVILPGPAVPRLTALSDAVNLLSAQHIGSGLIKATIEEVDDIKSFDARVDGIPAKEIETFRTDPLAERWEVNFRVPRKTRQGGHVLEIRLGRRLLARMGIICAALMAAIGLQAQGTEAALRKALAAKTGSVTLPPGEIEIAREVVMPTDAHDLDIHGAANTTIKAAAAFRGRALLVFPAGKNIKIRDLSLDGNRDAVGRMIGLPPSGTMFSRFMPNNGILAEGVAGLEIAQVKATGMAGFTVLVNGGHNVRIREVTIGDSGGFNGQRRNNGTGGIALEEGTTDFEISRCVLGTIRGNGITMRSVERGRVFENEFIVMARDAFQVNQATAVTIENNNAAQMGFPIDEVEAPGAICMRLEGFSDGRVKDNTCSEAVLGAISVAGTHNVISGNHLMGLNAAHRDAAGIYLEAGAKDNTIENNEIAGFGMSKQCLGAAPGVALTANKVVRNSCSDEVSVARLLPATPR
ncbi:MAG: methyltransferase domain-containing protein [Bryobacteraceae bacterium]|jgi:SAM-dependent methyltransferase